MTLALPDVMTTGVTLVAAKRIPDAAVGAALDVAATRAPLALRIGADDEALGALAFGGDGELVATVVRRVDPEIVRDRVDVAALLDGSAVDALRIDVALRRDETRFLVDAESALVTIAHELVASANALAIDDLGQVYDPEELARLAGRGEPRAFAFSYALTAALRATRLLPLDAVPPEVPETASWVAPTSPYGDVADTERLGFVIRGTHVPMVQLARIALALADDPRGNAAELAVCGTAPNVAAAEGLRLAAFGVDLTRLPEPDPAPPVPLRRDARDEIDVVLAELTRAEALAVLRETTVALVADGGVAFIDAPALLDVADAALPTPAPLLLAAYDLADDARVDVYHLDLATADPTFTRFLETRDELRLLLDGPIGAVVAIEISAPPRSGESPGDGGVPPRADALAVTLASAVLERFRGVAFDTRGAIYGADELARLAIRRAGRAQSWSARTARFST